MERKSHGRAPFGKPGVSINDSRAYKGYTLIAPMSSVMTYLVDMEGRVVKTWKSDAFPALSTYLLDNGHLLRPCEANTAGLDVSGNGGRVQEFDWDGELVWDYKFQDKDQRPHHDITRLPNGNILMIVAERKTASQTIAAGERTDRGEMYADALLEIKPTGKTTGEIVWEWHSWDHLVQDFSRDRHNFADVAENWQRIDVNFGQSMFSKNAANKDDLNKLKALGYLGPNAKPAAEWTHFNSVDYNADLDQIMVCVHCFNELWIIDHSTSTQEAAGSTGGKYGKGGDLLYRWGNPLAYHLGSRDSQQLYHQHNAHWIPSGLPGAGNVLVFNNGASGFSKSPISQTEHFSSVDEIIPPVNKDGTYEFKEKTPFGPSQPAWSYTAPIKTEFSAKVFSGAHRLPNGNTLICSGMDCVVFEVTPQKEVVWRIVARLPATGPLFRAYRYGVDHPAVRGRHMMRAKKLEEF